MDIDKKLQGEMKSFCELNDLDYEKFFKVCLKTGFAVAKYGMTPIGKKDVPKPPPPPPSRKIIEGKAPTPPPVAEEDIYGEKE